MTERTKIFGFLVNRDLVFVNANLVFFMFLGLGACIAVWWDRWSVAILWGCASGAVGFILGFIFGFPRTVTQSVSQASAPAGSQQLSDPKDKANSSTLDNRAARLSVNTNLEQVSDWITKTIVAIGLVDLRQFPDHFGQLAVYAGRSLGRPYTGASGAETAAALISYFVVLGFLAGYLLTRMFFQVAFGKGDRALEDAADVLDSAPSPSAIGPRTDPESALPGGLSAAAEKVKAVPPSVAKQYGISAVTLARANLLTGNTGKAIEAYRTAIQSDSWNPQLRFEYASALERAGAKRDDVIVALRDARALESQNPDPDLRRKIFESLTFLELYEPEPEGFTQAILYGTSYVSNPASLPSAVIWVNLAAAYGQQARWSMKHGDGIDGGAKSRALEAVKKAINLDSSQKRFLASLLEPTADSEDDDLSVFREMNEFRSVLGLPEIKSNPS